MDKIDRATVEGGLPIARHRLLSERGTHAQPQWDDEQYTRNILQDSTKPVILVSNHTHQLEPYLSLAILPPRKNVSIIGISGAEHKELPPERRKEKLLGFANILEHEYNTWRTS